MNQTLKKINEEKVLFFDIEDVSRNKELDINSREFELYRKKTRNRETDEYLPNDEVIEEYRKKAALKMCYTKIVSIGVGFIKDGEVHVKALEGTEEEIIKQFCVISQSFDYVCGANVIKFDLPMICNNGYRYFDVCEVLPDRFLVNGKKIWNIDKVVDLQDTFQATHYSPSSVDEMCYHFDLPSPKTELEGSQVSEEYWKNGVNKINSYVKQDVFANVNLFKKMRFEQPFESFVDKNNGNSDLQIQEPSILEQIYKATNISNETKQRIETVLSKKKLTKKDRTIIEDILISLYIDNTMFKSDTETTKERKRNEIKKILNAIKTS